MKIVHVITRLILGGAQENTLLTVEQQHQAQGHDVTLITGPALGPEGSLLERARGGGFRLMELDCLRRALDPGKDWQSYRRLLGLLRDLQPDVVHTHSSKAGILGRAAAAQLKLPAVHTIHGAAFHVGQSKLAFAAYRQAERRAARWTRHFISVADAMTDEYVAARVAPRAQFTTIYSGFDVEPFLHPPRPRDAVRRDLGLGPEHVVLGKIARLFPLKGHAELLAAAPGICRQRPNVRFLLVGDGVLRESLEQQLRSLGLRDRFVFTGLVPQERIPELMGAMDVVVHTSLWEGLARVLPQALVSGRPVASFDVGGAGEVVRPGATGVLVAPGDVSGLTEGVCRLADDPQLRAEYGAEGRRMFTDVFRHTRMAREVTAVYERVLQGATSP